MSFDRQLFSAAIQSKLIRDDITGREAARQAGVSPSTISRMISQELLPDIESFALLVKWMQINANIFLQTPTVTLTECERWAWLILCLNELEIPEELIKATVTILRLIAYPKQGGTP